MSVAKKFRQALEAPFTRLGLAAIPLLPRRVAGLRLRSTGRIRSMGQFPITRTTAPKAKPADDSLAFGKVLTDHMFLMNYEEGKGWFNPRIEPYGPLSMDPATSVLHYGQAIFDGLKAFRGDDGQIRLFRADRHAQRFNRSAKLMSMPELPVPSTTPPLPATCNGCARAASRRCRTCSS